MDFSGGLIDVIPSGAEGLGDAKKNTFHLNTEYLNKICSLVFLKHQLPTPPSNLVLFFIDIYKRNSYDGSYI
ncbi:hypothetical protein BD809_11155 [Aquimarina intermedia]|uniref:Uncharacterized protein n=1 Tax=Aquimarina intermedia TaxID=350814 RepID=A0A5S5BV34_9FLAO|nr:hypothetical protein BD809_11155 [Aquimarina intermedia]